MKYCCKCGAPLQGGICYSFRPEGGFAPVYDAENHIDPSGGSDRLLCQACYQRLSGGGKEPSQPKRAGGAAPAIVMSAVLAAVLLLFACALIFGNSGAAERENAGSLAAWQSSGAGTADAGPETVEITAPYASSLGQAPVPGEPETVGDSDEYVLPGSDSTYISREVIAALTPEELRLARNEIYARHGRIFEDPVLSGYFESKSWYQPLYEGAAFDALGDAVLNQYEIANRDLIIEYERQNAAD